MLSIFQSTQPEWAATAVGSNPTTAPTLFQSTQPEWAATGVAGKEIYGLLFQSTQPEWAATIDDENSGYNNLISIHAARVGCDSRAKSSIFTASGFQSTQPEWAATSFLFAKRSD